MKPASAEVVRVLHPSILVLAQREVFVDLGPFTRASFEWLAIPGHVPLLRRIRHLWSALISALRLCPTLSLARLPVVLGDDAQLAALIVQADVKTRSDLIAHFRGDVDLLCHLRQHLPARTIETSLTCGPQYAGPHARPVLVHALERRLFGGAP